MLLLLFLSLLFSQVSSDAIAENMEYSAIEDPFAVTTPAEKAHMIIEEVFALYPSLKPATNEEINDLKKSFMEFLGLRHSERIERFSSLSTEPKQLDLLLQGLHKVLDVEFQSLSDEELEFLGNVNEFVIHKLCVQGVLKVIREKEAEYEKRNMTRDEIKKVAMLVGASYANSWGIDPEEIVDQWVIKTRRDEL